MDCVYDGSCACKSRRPMAALHLSHVHPSFWWRIEHCPTAPKFLVPIWYQNAWHTRKVSGTNFWYQKLGRRTWVVCHGPKRRVCQMSRRTNTLWSWRLISGRQMRRRGRRRMMRWAWRLVRRPDHKFYRVMITHSLRLTTQAGLFSVQFYTKVVLKKFVQFYSVKYAVNW